MASIDPDVQVELDKLIKRLEALEQSLPIPAVHPNKVVEHYDDFELTYEVKKD